MTRRGTITKQDYELHLGDALEILPRMPAESVDCVWTDPPYFLSNGGISFQNGKVTSVNKGEWDRSRGFENDLAFHRAWIRECHRILKPHGTIWISGTFHSYPSCGVALQEAGFRLLNDIVWVKPNPPPLIYKRRFEYATEIVLWASKTLRGSPSHHTFNYEEMRAINGRPMQNVWTLHPAGRAEKALGWHPTQKPVKLIDRCLQASTAIGDLAMDPFMGSGSAAVAALCAGRRFIGIEQDMSHFDTAFRRACDAAGTRAAVGTFLSRSPQFPP